MCFAVIVVDLLTYYTYLSTVIVSDLLQVRTYQVPVGKDYGTLRQGDKQDLFQEAVLVA